MIYRTLTMAAMVVAFGFAGAGAAASERAAGLYEPDLALMDQVVNSSKGEIQLARRGRNAALIGGLVAGALITGAVMSNERRERRNEPRERPNYYYDRRGYRGDGYHNAKRRCADRYNSYSWKTDTFITYGGYEKLCPYVRPYY
ncbi:MAG: BA14K family protein [Gammaproteobacteria bacterium]|nr:BA14K family protein [Gammaproteobacteria bacterium]MBU1655755.1 BA14K family protein [Gammaproteobacteria bacterium]MBU1959932.1 BA14K family protein [Gammaproteobacteria bacterium]